jgi:hypothetical protein
MRALCQNRFLEIRGNQPTSCSHLVVVEGPPGRPDSVLLYKQRQTLYIDPIIQLRTLKLAPIRMRTNERPQSLHPSIRSFVFEEGLLRGELGGSGESVWNSRDSNEFGHNTGPFCSRSPFRIHSIFLEHIN